MTEEAEVVSAVEQTEEVRAEARRKSFRRWSKPWPGGGRTQTKSGRTQTEFQNPESTSETESTAEAGREETGDQGDHHSGEAYYP